MGYKRFITIEGEDYDATLIQSMNIGQVKMLCSFVDNEKDHIILSSELVG